MPLALHPPIAPMEALAVSEIPAGDHWQYEPKWDGFRCLAFRDGKEVELQSKSQQSLTRYFPDVVATVLQLPQRQFVLDTEIAVPIDGRFSFDALLQRIHPAASRVRKLAAETPAVLIVFDLLANAKGSLLQCPLVQRRQALEKFGATFSAEDGPVRLSPATTKIRLARKWLSQTGATLDGIIAKRTDLPYRTGGRDGMQKIKNFRSADCVVGGFRYGKGTKRVASLLLGLYDRAGLLHHVGFTSGIAAADRPGLTTRLESLIEPPGFTGDAPGGSSRWNRGQENPWHPLRPKLVVEVSYDHVTGGRFRHGTKLLRWRPDKSPSQCAMDQISQP